MTDPRLTNLVVDEVLDHLHTMYDRIYEHDERAKHLGINHDYTSGLMTAIVELDEDLKQRYQINEENR